MHQLQSSGKIYFIEDHLEGMHPTFREAMSQQLAEKGAQTGIRAFEKQEWMVMVGLRSMELTADGPRVRASIDFIVAPAWSFPVSITWESQNENANLMDLHRQAVQAEEVVFNWAEDFPIETISPFFKPYKVKKSAKSGWGFDVQYYRHMFPDLSFELFFAEPPAPETLARVDTFFRDFKDGWNAKKQDKPIQFIGEAMKKEDHWEVVMDLGRDNSDRLIGVLLKALAGELGEQLKLVNVR